MLPKNFELPLTYAQITQILPHRYPFLMVDRVVELVENQSILAYKNVTANEAFFNGHFPNLPVMPGVLQIEAMAQAGGILAFLSGHFDPKTQVGLLAGVDEAKFRRPVVPGDRLDLQVELVSHKRVVSKLRCKALVNGELASEAVIIAVVKDIDRKDVIS